MREVNSLSGYLTVLMSLIALLAVVAGYGEPPQTDEGTAAHIFQLAIVLLAPTILIFLVTGDWSQPLSTARPLMFSAAALAFAFGALYYLEHYRNPAEGAAQWNGLFVHQKQGFPGCARYGVPARHSERRDGVIQIRFVFRDRWDGHRGTRTAAMRIRVGGFLECFVAWLSSHGNFLTPERVS